VRSVTPSRYRADDWIRTSINRFTKPAPSYSATSAKQECKESNPAGRFWRPLASQKHTPEGQGVSDGSRTRTSCFTGRRAYRVHYRHHDVSSPTRIRTWNISLEARDDVHFTIEPFHNHQHKRKAWDLNPHDPCRVARFSKPARRTVSGYLPFQWSHRELNPDFQSAELVSSRWTMTPSVDRRGVEPRLPGCKPSVLPLNEQPIY
jgi:hypothetical protein